MIFSKRPFIISLIVILITVAAALFFNTGGKNASQGARGKGGKDSAQIEIAVRTKAAEIRTLHDYVLTNGEIEALNSVAVYPDIGGKILSVNVLLGDNVKRGDVIARIDPSEPGARYALSPVVAPISGSIISTPLKPGTTVTTGSTVAIIGDIKNLQVTAKIPERYTAVLKTGLKANIVLQAYPDIVFTATVTRVSPVVDAASRTKEIILKFDEDDTRINAGMFANVTLYTLDYSGSIVVTNNAIVTKGDKKYVFVASDDTDTKETFAKQTEVTLGEAVDGFTQILSGVAEGERIVIEGVQSLSDGVRIRDVSVSAGQKDMPENSNKADSINQSDKEKPKNNADAGSSNNGGDR
ncbi:efflux RND transporter periplasmic adaptor subunit [Treponema parvum]|uniref:Efflux RND transporter periplasmic adaptor subunit n=1 Tax=Treponema parvum TaxID=138851 RepID=A0A975F208_9SPIR|nr:efflux RND transporter periplasmic adaptor subunit [Treponema parvum]QTQ12654.1 efflux RND transporter periplasmic adaptor subunit [Treponema parvum]